MPSISAHLGGLSGSGSETLVPKGAEPCSPGPSDALAAVHADWLSGLGQKEPGDASTGHSRARCVLLCPLR